ncbi:PhzF family phenazine biosynthesis protein [Thermoflavimicrobium daqui]|uniref:Phenazine biosynthesis protein n=1 Tax=Thermoflavimicrobium daqui TaxID=2137476 RepID=A0A364K9K0_9BACL|nr:PhzF family phenazine biosynthesis protein [Thermoflavimicrobium daqui]RAL26963.1 phenazine biosynthesis protein [Thermoflavimicrobium daqui]
MKKSKLYIVDVFAEEKYTGNQLAVFTHANSFSDQKMQQLAREMNYSETTFICSDQKEADGGYTVRIFTPEAELPFAGHPTLGTAYVIQRELLSQMENKIFLNLQVGQIPIIIADEFLWMKQNEPLFGQIFERSEIAPVLNLDEDEIDERFPIQDVSTGLPFIIVPIKSLSSVKKAKVDQELLNRLTQYTRGKSILIFCPETYHSGHDLNVRVFVDCYGIPEDPATGSANGCLAGYLVKYRYFDKDDIDLRVEQGYEIQRPSLVYLNAKYMDKKIDISIGGKVVLVVKGELV